jgi:hypothetical protein
MTTRRNFLQLALTAPLLPASLRLASPDSRVETASAPATPGILYAVLCDERFGESVAFAEEMARHGTSITRFRGDITEFWYQDLSQRWKTDPVAIAGVTTHGPLFCLERWAWDHGLRIAERQDLPVQGGHETLIKWVIAPYRRNLRT